MPLRMFGDQALARLAARGNDAAFSAIFDRHHQSLYRYALTILGNREDAFDAVQNAMVKLLGSLPGEQREIKLKPWLFKIVHNEAVSIARGRKPAAADAVEDVSFEDSPDERMRAQAIIADLSLLGDQQRSAVAMRELNGLSHAEIGTALGVSTAAAKQAVYEGRVALQEIEEGREMSCTSVQMSLSADDRRLIKGRQVRSHLRSCSSCRAFEDAIGRRRGELAMIAPLPAVLSAKLLAGILGGGGGPAGGLGASLLGGGALAKYGAAAALVVGGGVALEGQVTKSEDEPVDDGSQGAPALFAGPSAPAQARRVSEPFSADAWLMRGELRLGGATPDKPKVSDQGKVTDQGNREAHGGGGGEKAEFTPTGGDAGGGGGHAPGGSGPGGGIGGPVDSGGCSGGGDQGAGGTGEKPDGGNDGTDPAGDGGSGGQPPQGNGPGHGQEIADSHDPGYPGNSAGHSQKPPSPPGLGQGTGLPPVPGGLANHGLKASGSTASSKGCASAA